MKRNKSIIAIGDFDGLHLGHQKIINYLRARANKTNQSAKIVTFTPHSRNSPILISRWLLNYYLRQQKIRVIAIPFYRIYHLNPTDFFFRILISKLSTSEIVVGNNFRFGFKRTGTIYTLKRLGDKYKVKVWTVPLYKDKLRTISASLIRKLLSRGNIVSVNKLLGRYYEFDGIVIPGKRWGRKIGFPTANLRIDKNQLLPSGIFAVTVKIYPHPKIYYGMMYIGPAPRFIPVKKSILTKNRVVEVFLLKFKGNLYGKRLLVSIYHKIRPVKEFDDVFSLKTQLQKDYLQSINFFNLV